MSVPTWLTTAVEIKHMKSQIQLQHPKKYRLNASEKAPQIASSHQVSISAPEARLTYISP